jgi:hypothetical protein
MPAANAPGIANNASSITAHLIRPRIPEHRKVLNTSPTTTPVNSPSGSAPVSLVGPITSSGPEEGSGEDGCGEADPSSPDDEGSGSDSVEADPVEDRGPPPPAQTAEPSPADTRPHEPPDDRPREFSPRPCENSIPFPVSAHANSPQPITKKAAHKSTAINIRNKEEFKRP